MGFSSVVLISLGRAPIVIDTNHCHAPGFCFRLQTSWGHVSFCSFPDPVSGIVPSTKQSSVCVCTLSRHSLEKTADTGRCKHVLCPAEARFSRHSQESRPARGWSHRGSGTTVCAEELRQQNPSRVWITGSEASGRTGAQSFLRHISLCSFWGGRPCGLLLTRLGSWGRKQGNVSQQTLKKRNPGKSATPSLLRASLLLMGHKIDVHILWAGLVWASFSIRPTENKQKVRQTERQKF